MEVNTISKEEYFNQHFKFKNGQESDKTKGEELKGRNPFDPLSYIDLFEKYDIPLIPFEWNKYLQKQIERQKSLIFVFGKYLSLMKLKGYKDFTFNDSQELFQSRINGALYQNHQFNKWK